ncbi:transketolase family protein, partial [Candidatus Omnitrophota bacterium]
MGSVTMRDAFFDSLYEIARKDKNVIIVSADMGAPSLDKFRENLAEQFVNVGIAEANMVTVATGLALGGKKVLIYAIMPFVTSRCYEFLKVDVSLMNIPITIVGVGPGFGYDDSGPTHHCTEDISIMRALPNMTILSPSDSVMTSAFARFVCKHENPSYIRLDRQVQPILYDAKKQFKNGCYKLRKGDDICILATGNMVHRALEVAELLSEQSIKASVVDVYIL